MGAIDSFPHSGGQLLGLACRLLVVGDGEGAQEHLAGALLTLLDGCALHTISLPALLVSGEVPVCPPPPPSKTCPSTRYLYPSLVRATA